MSTPENPGAESRPLGADDGPRRIRRFQDRQAPAVAATPALS